MYSRTITHTAPGPVTLALTTSAGPIEVRVEPERTHADVVLTHEGDDDEQARKVIKDTTTTSSGAEFTVTVPRRKGTAVSGGRVFSSGGVTSIISGDVTGTVVQGGNISVSGDIFGSATVIHHGAGGTVTATVLLPPGSSLRVDSDGADLRTAGHLEAVRYRGSGGSVDVESTVELDVDTSGGNVRAERADTATVETSGGNIQIRTTARADLRSSGGNIRIHKVSKGGRAQARTSGGNIQIHALDGATVRARTSGGDVDVTADPGATVDCEARSSGGRVRTPH